MRMKSQLTAMPISTPVVSAATMTQPPDSSASQPEFQTATLDQWAKAAAKS